jgi:SnoaL-like domain
VTAANPAQKIAEGFVRAWTGGDVETALTFVADDVVCEAPNGTFKGVDGLRQFLAPFVSTITSATVIDVLGDDTHAAAVYVTETPFLKNFRGMDYLTVVDGKITHVISHFDLLPLHQAGGNTSH